MLDLIRKRWQHLAGLVLHLFNFQNLPQLRDPKHKNNSLLSRMLDYLRIFHDSRSTLEGVLRVHDFNAKVFCDFRDWLIRPYLINRTELYEVDQIRHAAERCGAGDVFIDVGANHGVWGACIGPKCGIDGRVVFVEPNPELARRLVQTSRLNRARFSSTVVQKAASDRYGQATFFLPLATNSGTGSTVLHDYAREHGYLDTGRQIRVECEPLDSIFGRLALTRVDIVKIDVEFAEDAVVDGAVNALRTFRPKLVVCETSAESRAYDTLCELGYTPYRVSGRTTVPVVKLDGYWGNVFFARNDHPGATVSVG